MIDENKERCDGCGRTADDCIHCVDCGLWLCHECVSVPCNAKEELPPLVPGMPEITPKEYYTAEPLPFTPAPVTHIQATIDVQLEILGILHHTATKAGSSARAKQQANDQFDIALRFIRMLVLK
jgi:hypothetical protein